MNSEIFNFFKNDQFSAEISNYAEIAARAQAKLEEVKAKRIGEVTVVIAAAGSRGGRFEDSYDMSLGGIIGTISSAKVDVPDYNLTIQLEDGDSAEIPFSTMKDKKVLIHLTKEQLMQIKVQFNALPAFRESGGRAGQITLVIGDEMQIGESTDLSGKNVLMFALTPLLVGDVKPTQRLMGVSSKAALNDLLRNSDDVAVNNRRTAMDRSIERRQRRRDVNQANNAAASSAPNSVNAINTSEDKLAAMDNAAGQP